MKLKKKNKKILFFSSSLIIFFIVLSVYTVSPLSPVVLEDENIYITSGDVIKNFQFDSFNGDLITFGSVYDNRLKLETGALWKAYPEDVVLTYVEQIGDKAYINYDILYSIDMNVYTNSRLNDIVEPGRTADPVSESFVAGVYNHYGCFGGAPHISWTSYLYYTHLDVGNIRSHNAENNLFSGNLKMSFDIDSSPLPDTLKDSNGNVANKSFDYIGVKSVYVDNTLYGSMSDSIPEIVGLTPSEYEDSRKTVSGGSAGTIAGDFYSKFNPDPVLGDTFVSNTVDYGVQYQSDGSSLFPTLKSGATLYDPRITEMSMPDCEFIYNVGSLSPLITEYSNTLTYYEQNLATQDYLASLIPFTAGIRVTSDINSRKSVTRVTGLQVTNRYIHTSIYVKFSVWSSYEIVPIEDTSLPELQYPEEYYDSLVYSSVVDGFGGGEIYKEPLVFTPIQFGYLAGIISSIVSLILIGVVVYIVAKRIRRRK